MPLAIWNESTRDELNAILPDSLVILPTAATEQHGPHLATGHDTFAVTQVALTAAARAGESANVVVAPTLAFGSSAHHLPFGGTLSLSTETYLHVVRDLITSIVTSGGRRILLLNGHGGNHELNQLAVRDAALEQDSSDPVSLAAASYWEIARPAIEADASLGTLAIPGHAGQFETAMMLALTPERVRDPRGERAHDPDARQRHGIPGLRREVTGAWASFDGYSDFPHRATMEQGMVLWEHVVREVAVAMVVLAE